jgi:hypothetical protein
MKGRQRSDGFATVEWTMALGLGLLVLAMAAQAGSTLLRFGLFEAHRAQWDQETFVAGAVLSGEVGRTSSPTDWRAHPGDSLSLRAFRGYAWICGSGPGSPATTTVVFQGDRDANPAKDSVLIHSADGGIGVVQLRARRAGRTRCGPPPGRPTEEWDLGAPVASEGILRLFESGTYSVGSGALRYRVGRGGRQPVVGARFDTTSSLRPRLTPTGRRAADLVLTSTPAPYRPTPLRFGRVVYSRRSIP